MIYLTYCVPEPRHAIRFSHEHVKGTDGAGERYHALNPEIFAFQHATYVDALMTSVELFRHRMTLREKEDLYAECYDWYLRYGVSARSLPRTWTGLGEYLDQACAARLRMTPEGEQLVGQVLWPDWWLVRSIPDGAVRAMQYDGARELLGVEAKRGDRLTLATYAASVRGGLSVAPRRVRYLRQARYGMAHPGA